jgi:hypothetical protein
MRLRGPFRPRRRADLSGDRYHELTQRLVAAIPRILGRAPR